MKVVVVTGGFDPLHSGHIQLINAARNLGDILIVGLNSDDWLTRKKGKPFLPFSERSKIISNLVDVNKIICFDDGNNTARDAIDKVRKMYNNGEIIIFANGGDRTSDNIPEMEGNDDIVFEFGVGGDYKKNSSSDILRNWSGEKTERIWGYYRVLHTDYGIKVKEIVVEPRKRLSLQYHNYRDEFWFVVEGIAHLYTDENVDPISFCPTETVQIKKNQWHMLANNGASVLKIIEIQYGSYCDESDIVRRS